MLQVRATGIDQIEVHEADAPTPGPGEVAVDLRLAGVCGSDTHAVAGHHGLLAPPYFPGHEATGVVAAVGEGVTGLAAGQRVALKPNVPCGECVNCVADRSNACQTLAWIGCDPSDAHPGAMAGTFLAPAGQLYPVPDHVSDEEAVLIECLATPVHAARRAGDLTGARVVVLGAGTIGLLSVLAARHAGAGRVVVTDLDAGKRERALRYGADAACDAAADDLTDAVRRELDGPADVVFDCVANARSAAQAVGVLRRAGTLLVVGVPAGDYALPMAPIQDWEITVQGCANYNETDFAAAVEIAAAGGIPADEIVTTHAPLSAAAVAFDTAAANSSGKVVLHP